MSRFFSTSAVGASLILLGACGSAQKAFTLQEILSAPYATSLTAAPAGVRFAWVENSEGRHNLWVGGANEAAHPITHSTEDDAQDVSSLAWSPDGATIAYVSGAETGANGRPANPAELQPPPPVQIFVVAADGQSQPKLIGEGRAPLFLRDGHSLLFLRGGQIWTTDAAATVSTAKDSPDAPRQLVFDRGSDSQLALSPDGFLLALVSRRDHDHSYIGVFDLKARTLRFPAPSTGNDSAPAFSLDGKQLAWLRTPFTDTPEFAANRVSANPWSIQILDLANAVVRTGYSPQANRPGSAFPHVAVGEPKLFWMAHEQVAFYAELEGMVHLYALNTKVPGAVTPVTSSGKFEVRDAVGSPDGTSLVFASNQSRGHVEDVDRQSLWRAEWKDGAWKTEALLKDQDGIAVHPTIAADGKTIAWLGSDERVPMHPEVLGNGKINLHHDPPQMYPATALLAPQQVLFPSGDKLLQLHGQLFLRKDLTAGRHPAILFFHGGPHRQMLLGYPDMDYYSNAYAMNQYLASRGFIVLSVNYRCGIGYGTDFRECEHAGADGATEYQDVLGAAAYLRSRADVDPARIGVWGGSYGGYLTALALARNSDLFAAGVDFHGVHDWVLEDNHADWLRGTNAEQDAIAARARASSPIADIGHWRSPVLLIHGDNDPDVAYRQTPMLADALRARGVHVEELIFPDELHGFLLHRDWLAAYEAAAAFFERSLQPAAAPKPIK
ncbi:MAG TPA: prolyl oligopeptidase family serine peptidase [Acidobacteriaceae bacterium]|jgi:dipeptidyl aminopeptidase/acylaminoacyl peptidase